MNIILMNVSVTWPTTSTQFGLTESSKKLDGSDNVGGKVHVDGDVGGVEDGHGVEDDGVDTCSQCYKTFYVRN